MKLWFALFNCRFDLMMSGLILPCQLAWHTLYLLLVKSNPDSTTGVQLIPKHLHFFHRTPLASLLTSPAILNPLTFLFSHPLILWRTVGESSMIKLISYPLFPDIHYSFLLSLVDNKYNLENRQVAIRQQELHQKQYIIARTRICHDPLQPESPSEYTAMCFSFQFSLCLLSHLHFLFSMLQWKKKIEKMIM